MTAAAAQGTGRLVAAPLRRRLASALYEGVLLFGIVFATGLVYAVAVRQTNAMEHRSGLIAACFLIMGLYFVGTWSRGGQTLAMKTWHLRVVTATGAPLTPLRAAARYVAAWLWVLPPLALSAAAFPRDVVTELGLPIAWMALYAFSSLLHPRRQFWHDVLCDTAVVSAAPVRRA